MAPPIAPVPVGTPAPVTEVTVETETTAAPPKSGWKTTEAWFTMLLLGGLATISQELVNVLPQILASPGIPPWVAPIAPLALVGLGWIAKRTVVEYNKTRVALKLGTDPQADAAAAAGKAAANGTVEKLIAALNK